MNIFPENYCRVCSEFFCCKICRLGHEENNHGIHLECNICIYGRAILKNPSESLLQHFKAAHWPLHCVFCKIIFTSVEDLILHSKCAMAQKVPDQENANSMITTAVSEENYDSPPITAIMHKSILTSSNKHNNRGWLTTSTPMQNFNERESLDHIPEVITPVDYAEKTNISDKLKSVNVDSVTSEQSKDAEPPLKRRVTFSEIEIINIETPYHNRKNRYVPSYDTNSGIKQEQDFLTPGSGTSNKNTTINSRNEYAGRHIYDGKRKATLYVTAYGEEIGDTPKVSTTQEHKNTYMDFTQSPATTDNDTAWESALMDPHVSTAEVSSNAANENLTEAINSTKSKGNQNLAESNILSPVIDPNLTESDVFSPIINSNLTESGVVNESLTEAVAESSITTPNVTKSEFQYPIANQNLIESENIQSHIIIVDSENPDIFSVVVNQNLTEIDASCIVDSKLQNPEVLPPVTNKNSDFLSSPVCSDLTKSAIALEILSPIINKNVPSKILSPDMQSSLGTDNTDTNYDALESSISGQTYGMNTTSHKSGIWSSMANIFKTVVQGLSSSTHGDRITRTNRHSSSHKRPKPEIDTSASESPMRKKIKLTHIRCRRTIRNVSPFLELSYGRKVVQTVDKWTQTD